MQKSEFCLFCWCIKREIILLQLFAQDQKITYVAAHTNGTVMSSARNYKDESRRVAITEKIIHVSFLLYISITVLAICQRVYTSMLQLERRNFLSSYVYVYN